jgi:hypothetical protein
MLCCFWLDPLVMQSFVGNHLRQGRLRTTSRSRVQGPVSHGLGQETLVLATAHRTPARDSFDFSGLSTTTGDTARRLFAALARLHGLDGHDGELLGRAAAGHRFIRAMQPFDDHGLALMRIALADLQTPRARVVEASAGYAADLVLDGTRGAWQRLCRADRHRVMWFAALLRLAEGIDAVGGPPLCAIHAAWTDEVLHLEIDGVPLSENQVKRILERSAALEAITERRVLLTSSTCRRGAA